MFAMNLVSHEQFLFFQVIPHSIRCCLALDVCRCLVLFFLLLYSCGGSFATI